MISDHVYIQKVVTLSLTADDWGLYDIEGRHDAALGLNQAVSTALNNFTKGVVIGKIEEALEKYRKWGAADTEGYDTVRQILGLFYK